MVAALYVHIAGDLRHVYTVESAMLQIYNEQVDCLLSDDRARAQNLTVNATGNTGVKDLMWIKCDSPDELLKAFQKGKQNLIYVSEGPLPSSKLPPNLSRPLLVLPSPR